MLMQESELPDARSNNCCNHQPINFIDVMKKEILRDRKSIHIPQRRHFTFRSISFPANDATQSNSQDSAMLWNAMIAMQK